jgi:membrane fusion protein
VSSLFRPEVVEAQRQQWLGRVQLVRPLSLTVLTLMVAAVAFLSGAYLFVGEYTRKALVSGVLAPDRGLIRLVPPVAGTVIERRVDEGRAVRAGEVLFVLAQDSSTLDAGAQAQVQRSWDERKRSLREASQQQQQLADAQRIALDRRLLALAREQTQIEAEAALHRQRLALAQQALERLQSLQADQFISSAQVQAKSEELLALRAQEQALERQRAGLARERAELEGERSSLPMRTRGTQSEIERDLAQLSREMAEYDAQRQFVVRAPQDGIVGAVLADPGQSVSPASALASLVPADAQLQAHLYAPSSAIGFVRAGQRVRLRFAAYPHQKFGHQGGHVLQVSRTPLAASELAGLSLPAQQAAGEPLFRITVALDEPALPQPLVAGLRLQADVLLERRRLIEWIFEPLLGLAGRL